MQSGTTDFLSGVPAGLRLKRVSSGWRIRIRPRLLSAYVFVLLEASAWLVLSTGMLVLFVWVLYGVWYGPPFQSLAKGGVVCIFLLLLGVFSLFSFRYAWPKIAHLIVGETLLLQRDRLCYSPASTLPEARLGVRSVSPNPEQFWNRPKTLNLERGTSFSFSLTPFVNGAAAYWMNGKFMGSQLLELRAAEGQFGIAEHLGNKEKEWLLALLRAWQLGELTFL